MSLLLSSAAAPLLSVATSLMVSIFEVRVGGCCCWLRDCALREAPAASPRGFRPAEDDDDRCDVLANDSCTDESTTLSSCSRLASRRGTVVPAGGDGAETSWECVPAATFGLVAFPVFRGAPVPPPPPRLLRLLLSELLFTAEATDEDTDESYAAGFFAAAAAAPVAEPLGAISGCPF